MTDPYPRHKSLPKGATWAEERKIRNEYALELPSPEKMRLEMETGVFSPESLAIADRVLEKAQAIAQADDDLYWEPREYMERTNAELRQMAIDEEDAGKKPLRDPENDDWWAEQEYFGAPREKSFIEQQTDDIMKRVTAAPLPSAAHFKKTTTEAKKTTKAFKRLAREMPKPRVGANLQQRPFLILSTLRDDLTK